MFAILVCFIFSSLIFFTFGNFFVKFIENQKIKNYTSFDHYFIGLCVVGSLLNIWSLFFPTNYVSFCILLFCAFLIIYINKFHYKVYYLELKNKLLKNNKILLLLILSLIIVLTFSIVTPKLYDTYLYHLNSIMWNEFYKTIPGLANLHDRFGFNSSVFVLSAGFSFNFIYEQYLFTINSLSFLVFLFWVLKLAITLNNSKSVFLLLFLFFFTNQYYLDISSPGTDLLPNIFLSYLLINLFLLEDVFAKRFLVYIALPLFCVTLKLSMLPVVSLSLIAIYYQKSQKKHTNLLKIIPYGLLFILPWIIRNVIISGYLLFPMPSIDVFTFDWKVPAENANITKEWIYSWGRVPMKDYKEILSLSFFEWVKIWWQNSLTINKIFYILTNLSLVFYSFLFFFGKLKTHQLIALFVSFAIGLAWFFTAPDIRFSFSTILFFAMSPLLFLNNPIDLFFTKIKPVVLIFSILVLFSIGQKAFYLFEEDYKSIDDFSYLYLPNDIYYVKFKQKTEYTTKALYTKSGEKILFFEPKNINTQCFDKFPCSSNLDSNLKLRGDDVSEGFLSTNK